MSEVSVMSDEAKPKHERLGEDLSQEVRRLEPGTLMPTVTDLMDRFQVSQGTVMHALRHLRAKGLVARPPGKKRLVVAGSRRRADAILSVLLLRPQWSSPDYDAVGYALSEEATRQRLHLDVLQYGSAWREDMRSLARAHDALIAIPSSADSGPLNAFLEEARLPVVMLWEKPETPVALRVADDDHAVGRLAVEHLRELGHRKIAAFLSEPPLVGMRRRLEGWADALRQAGERHPERLIVDCSVEPGKDAILGSYEKLRRWLFRNQNRIPGTAVFCLCWTGALGMLRALREVGLDVPGDVSVLTHGGENRLCEFSNPALTTVQTDLSEFARESLGLVKTVCLGETPTRAEVLLTPFLIERESTRRITPKKP